MLTLIAAILSSGLALAAGFSQGDDCVSTYLRGKVTVFCHTDEFPRSISYQCETDILQPVEFDYFILDEDLDVSQVTLRSNANKRKVKQSRSYNTEKSRSSQRFNLWISTITQTPLLQLGENTIRYEATKNRKLVKKGEFKVMVDEGEPRMCTPRTIHSSNPDDCRGPRNTVCSEYFRVEGYCQ